MKTILNLHGLFGESENFNYRILNDAFSNKLEIISPSIDFEANPYSILEMLRVKDFDLIVANSFGGFFGYIFSSIMDVPAILCNPCIPPEDYILNLVPNYRYIEDLKDLWNTHKNSNSKIVSILGQNDVVIDPYKTAYLFHIENKPIYTVNEGHKLCGPTFEYILKYEVSRCLDI